MSDHERIIELLSTKGWGADGLSTTEIVAALLSLRTALQAFFDEWDGDVGSYAPTDATEELMRTALAGETTNHE